MPLARRSQPATTTLRECSAPPFPSSSTCAQTSRTSAKSPCRHRLALELPALGFGRLAHGSERPSALPPPPMPDPSAEQRATRHACIFGVPTGTTTGRARVRGSDVSSFGGSHPYLLVVILLRALRWFTAQPPEGCRPEEAGTTRPEGSREMRQASTATTWRRSTSRGHRASVRTEGGVASPPAGHTRSSPARRPPNPVARSLGWHQGGNRVATRVAEMGRKL
mgnify:CR=1 FL=1